MAILTTSNLAQSYGALDIFSGLSVSIPNNGKIGLVGPNGIGKTTLLLILAGMNQPSQGSVHRAKGKTLGYLPQESARAFEGRRHSVYDEMLTIFQDLREQEESLRQLEKDMSSGYGLAELLEQYGAAQEKFELAGGYAYEIRIKQVLQGLGFGREEWTLPLDVLSGGQKTRTLLARLLLEEPDLLILDEPTNHLDVAAIEWLENTLKSWEGAVVVVSHDRYFLDRVVNTIWEMGGGTVEVYRGNYSAYVAGRAERWAQREEAFKARKQRLEKELDYIRRNIAGQRTQMAKGKLSRISRELDAIQRAGLEGIKGKSWAEISQAIGGASRHSMSVDEVARAIKQLQKPDGSSEAFTVDLNSDQRSGHIVLRTHDLVIGYPGKPLFKAEDIELHRLECAALIGPNGTGKTTFLRTILGRIEPLSGHLRLGASLNIGYFAQAHEQLNPDNTVIDELMRHHEMPVSEARKYLARYLFHGNEVFRPVGILSGGERGRLALAILALEGANLLLLDEPTNHLDLPAQEMLQEVLEGYDGTILMVSHDRYLVDRLATQIWELDDRSLSVFGGSYAEFVAERERKAEQARLERAETQETAQEQPQRTSLSKNMIRRMAERLSDIEGEITKLEAHQETLSVRLQEASQEGSFEKIQAISAEYESVQERLETLLLEWEKLAREHSLAG